MEQRCRSTKTTNQSYEADDADVEADVFQLCHQGAGVHQRDGHSGALYDGQHPSSSDSEQPLDLPPPGLQNSDDKQTVRHVLLCLLLSVSLLANLSSCLWWLFNKDPGRLYLELQFFCAVANYGQGFLSFGIFGLDKHLIIVPFKKRWAETSAVISHCFCNVF
ncbi:hypothetical protein CCH79_00020459 [Gambusia affinis]|uniref:Uncharacterized protein n=1 Tax=Gambusia affinis TaxID=33528 RepID=A0A315VT08_GAMAF|nr:hypothetical protein CCH79_00020459 [Gambusia affinis]